MKTIVIVNGKNGDCLKNSITRSEGIRTSLDETVYMVC